MKFSIGTLPLLAKSHDPSKKVPLSSRKAKLKQGGHILLDSIDDQKQKELLYILLIILRLFQ